VQSSEIRRRPLSTSSRRRLSTFRWAPCRAAHQCVRQRPTQPQVRWPPALERHSLDIAKPPSLVRAHLPRDRCRWDKERRTPGDGTQPSECQAGIRMRRGDTVLRTHVTGCCHARTSTHQIASVLLASEDIPASQPQVCVDCKPSGGVTDSGALHGASPARPPLTMTVSGTRRQPTWRATLRATPGRSRSKIMGPGWGRTVRHRSAPADTGWHGSCPLTCADGLAQHRSSLSGMQVVGLLIRGLGFKSLAAHPSRRTPSDLASCLHGRRARVHSGTRWGRNGGGPTRSLARTKSADASVPRSPLWFRDSANLATQVAQDRGKASDLPEHEGALHPPCGPCSSRYLTTPAIALFRYRGRRSGRPDNPVRAPSARRPGRRP
jgi:hypothetical protein